jgi:hypothetical protein
MPHRRAADDNTPPMWCELETGPLPRLARLVTLRGWLRWDGVARSDTHSDEGVNDGQDDEG